MSFTAADLKVKIFADGADLEGIRLAAKDPLICGFTTNPTLMRKAAIDDYAQFARDVLGIVPDLPISFEVFSDDFEEMKEQARTLSALGSNVYVKIPITNTDGASAAKLVTQLSALGIKVNVTAVMTVEQVETIAPALAASPGAFVSVFAGRIADAGTDPLPIVREAVDILRRLPLVECIWASPREVLNAVQADLVGCQVITMTNDLIAKLGLLGKDLTTYSLETVEMFRRDAVAAGYTL